jgi:GTP cyclohydrolase I
MIPLSPIRKTSLTNEQKISLIEDRFKEIMDILGLDLNDDSLQKTPHRVAKMYVNELFESLKENSFPKITTQENKFNYDQMLIETGIEVNSVCEHHFVPILGRCHIAYIPKKKLIGLSKLNRVAKYYASRPQVQERMTEQIARHLCDILGTNDVAVVIDAAHMCVKMRGVKDADCITRTTSLRGKFKDDEKCRAEFMAAIPRMTNGQR